MPASILSTNVIIGKDMHHMDPKKNLATATYARGKKDLQGLSQMIKDPPINHRKQQIDLHDTKKEVRDSRIGLQESKCFYSFYNLIPSYTTRMYIFTQRGLFCDLLICVCFYESRPW